MYAEAAVDGANGASDSRTHSSDTRRTTSSSHSAQSYVRVPSATVGASRDRNPTRDGAYQRESLRGSRSGNSRGGGAAQNMVGVSVACTCVAM